MWFSTRGFLRIKLKLLSLEQLTDLRRDITAALILTTEETEKRYRAALAHPGDRREVEDARAKLAQRADYLEAARSFLWADFMWPSLPSVVEGGQTALHAVPPEDAASRH